MSCSLLEFTCSSYLSTLSWARKHVAVVVFWHLFASSCTEIVSRLLASHCAGCVSRAALGRLHGDNRCLSWDPGLHLFFFTSDNLGGVCSFWPIVVGESHVGDVLQFIPRVHVISHNDIILALITGAQVYCRSKFSRVWRAIVWGALWSMRSSILGK